MRIPSAVQCNKTKSTTKAVTHVEQDKAFIPKSKGQNCIYQCVQHNNNSAPYYYVHNKKCDRCSKTKHSNTQNTQSRRTQLT